MAHTAQYKPVYVSEESYGEASGPQESPINFGLRFEKDETLESYLDREASEIQERKNLVENLVLEEQDAIDYEGRYVPWDFSKFTKDLIEDGFKYTYGEHEDWGVGVIDGDFKTVFEKKFETFQGTYELWKDLLTTSLAALLPGEDFSLYVLAHGKEGRPLPIYYMEVRRNVNNPDRSGEKFIVWEMDQGTRKRIDGDSKLDRGLDMAEYAHTYTKIFFFIKEQDMEEQSGILKIDRASVANLKRADGNWDEWLEEQHESKPLDAIASVVILSAALAGSIMFNEAVIAVFAGIIVAGIASEEWLAPHTIFFGALARFLKNEALALRMYYRLDFSMGIKALIITLLASAGELAFIFGTNSVAFAIGDISVTTVQAILIFTSSVNIFCLLPCAMSYLYAGVRVRDLPKDKYLQPKLYINNQYPFLRTYLSNAVWPPTNSTKNVARIRLHWSRGGYENNVEGFLSGNCCRSKAKVEQQAVPAPTVEEQGEAIIDAEAGENVESTATKEPAAPVAKVEGAVIDLAAPGSPSSMRCLAICLPATALIYQSLLMSGSFFFNGQIGLGKKALTCLCLVVEWFLVSLGAIVIIICDVPAALLLGLARFLLHVLDYRTVRDLLVAAPFPLAGYNLADLVLIVYMKLYTPLACEALNLSPMTCRSKSIARWYRLPKTKKVRTGRQSNHAWKAGSYFQDQYYVCEDIVMMNPRWSYMGIVDANWNVNGNNKCVWTSRGRKYCNPSICF